MVLLFLLLLVAAFVCFLLVAFGVKVGRVNLLGLGLALWVLVAVLQTFQKV